MLLFTGVDSSPFNFCDFGNDRAGEGTLEGLVQIYSQAIDRGNTPLKTAVLAGLSLNGSMWGVGPPHRAYMTLSQYAII